MREAGAPSSGPGGVPPSTPSKGKGKRPRGALRPSFQTARADQKYYDDLDAGIPEPEAFRRHKNRFRALMHAFRTQCHLRQRADAAMASSPRFSPRDAGIAKTSFDKGAPGSTGSLPHGRGKQPGHQFRAVDQLQGKLPPRRPSIGDVPSDQSRSGPRFHARRRKTYFEGEVISRPFDSWRGRFRRATSLSRLSGCSSPSVGDLMEVEVVLESGMVPDYDLPDYDE